MCRLVYDLHRTEPGCAGANGIDDVARLTPGITFVLYAPREQGLITTRARTSTSAESTPTAGASTTGILIDDTPIQSRKIGFGTQNAYPAAFDLDRIEVLRGPQVPCSGRVPKVVPSLHPAAPSLQTRSGVPQVGSS